MEWILFSSRFIFDPLHQFIVFKIAAKILQEVPEKFWFSALTYIFVG